MVILLKNGLAVKFFLLHPLPPRNSFSLCLPRLNKEIKKDSRNSLGALGNSTMLAGGTVFGLANRVFQTQGGAFAIIKKHPRGLESTQYFLGAINNLGCEYMTSNLLRSHPGLTDGP